MRVGRKANGSQLVITEHPSAKPAGPPGKNIQKEVLGTADSLTRDKAIH